ncbi:MAG: di-trans,poly-cis-decaprenylcistransferase [Gammaproteobacteria bacterium TMED78]|nr:MAG: di-trans,poly-cis-decaprenylcistransferase [Gammaproteobacteria bacterium TMED78]|tara:strand:+ start:1987 stop:2718 length:732 start_codon:yes stop_codon:yes gene_type:complete
MNRAVPSHIAIIMDGNGRWAKQRSLPRKSGHKAGINPTRDVIKFCMKRKIKTLTLFIFSTENWSRPMDEINWIMELFLSTLKSEIDELHKQGVRLRFIGDMSSLNEQIKMSISNAEKLTVNNNNMNLVLAISYGGRQDILSASKKIIKKSKSDDTFFPEISEDIFESELMTTLLPNVDLLIRTGGEKRVSNFLLWQIAYAEIYFTDILWPSFTEKDLDEALIFYSNRERRFGKISKQLEERDC